MRNGPVGVRCGAMCRVVEISREVLAMYCSGVEGAGEARVTAFSRLVLSLIDVSAVSPS